MPTPPLAAEKRQEIVELLERQDRPSYDEIRRIVGVSIGTISRIAAEVGKRHVSSGHRPDLTDFEAAIRKLLSRDAMSALELADALDCGPSKVTAALEEMRARHVNIRLRPDDRYDLNGVLEPGGKLEHSIPDRGDGWQVFGMVADNHLCNRHARLDVLNSLYDRFAEEGVKDVYNCGNWIDGEAKFNRQELLVFGMDRQLQYFLEHYPSRAGITTHYIAGDDHEGWYAQRECIDIGKHLELMAKDGGRNDLHYLGYLEHDIELRHGCGSSVLRVKHAGGGSAYAISYTSQKQVESYQGGEKPHIEAIGHFHKFDYCYPREVHTIQVGCTEDQTMFMRKKRIQAMVGGCIGWLKQDSRGAIERFRVEWIPFFDRGYYSRSFD